MYQLRCSFLVLPADFATVTTHQRLKGQNLSSILPKLSSEGIFRTSPPRHASRTIKIYPGNIGKLTAFLCRYIFPFFAVHVTQVVPGLLLWDSVCHQERFRILFRPQSRPDQGSGQFGSLMQTTILQLLIRHAVKLSFIRQIRNPDNLKSAVAKYNNRNNLQHRKSVSGKWQTRTGKFFSVSLSPYTFYSILCFPVKVNRILRFFLHFRVESDLLRTFVSERSQITNESGLHLRSRSCASDTLEAAMQAKPPSFTLPRS